MRHRPIKKMRKSPWVLIFGVLMNCTIAYLFFYELQKTIFNETVPLTFLTEAHYALVIASAFCFMLVVPSFFMASFMSPGHLEKKYDFVDLVQELIHDEIDIEVLCTYCEVIKSETSFHCMFCGKCTEMFDHHCPFINNCLGFRNYKYFLIFVFAYFGFLVFTICELLRY